MSLDVDEYIGLVAVAEYCGNVSQLQFLVDVVGKHWSRTVEQTAASVLQGRVCNAQ